MALDGVFIKKLTAELQEAVNTHIDKIHQPSADELVLLLRKPAFNKRLLISVRSGFQRIHFTDMRLDNPPAPPMFCMLLRKYVGSGRILKITQPEYERLIEITFSSLNEMGDVITPRLIIELISSAPNVILVGENGKIIDALKRSNIENGGRLIQPGAVYEYPEKQLKINPEKKNLQKILSALESGDAERGLLATVAGFSPLICREIADGYISLENTLSVIENNSTPYIIKDKNGEPFDFSYLPIKQYSGYTVEEKESFCELLDAFYSEKAEKSFLKHRSQDIEKLLNNLAIRIKKRMNLRKIDLQKCENRERLRIYGELLKANLYALESGMTSVTVQNFYDENLSDIKIPLNPALSPQANAAKYFKDYKKTYTAEQTLTELIANDEKELKYIESVAFALGNAKFAADIDEIREELMLAGYIRQNKSNRPKKADNKFKEAVSPSGYRICIGKNNRQNDLLTCSIATKGDMWFHTKNIPGSHIIVFCNGNELSNEDIMFAATLAAENSKAASSAQVPVDYTRIKFVKKPNGAKPGMVIYTTNNTVFVTPSEVDND